MSNLWLPTKFTACSDLVKFWLPFTLAPSIKWAAIYSWRIRSWQLLARAQLKRTILVHEVLLELNYCLVCSLGLVPVTKLVERELLVQMDAWGTLDIVSAFVRDDINSSFRRAKKTVGTWLYQTCKISLHEVLYQKVAKYKIIVTFDAKADHLKALSSVSLKSRNILERNKHCCIWYTL